MMRAVFGGVALILLGISLTLVSSEELKAECNVEPNPAFSPETRQNVTGKVTFTQQSAGGEVTIKVQLSGFNTSDQDDQHGFHVHEFGAISDITGCSSSGAHYNPESKKHGAPTASERHVGDLGNVEEDINGEVDTIITDTVISLSGIHSVIHRGIVVHANRDDLGLGGDAGSEESGNAGVRLACCVIEEVPTGAAARLGQQVALVAIISLLLASS